jgi:hypothetical protein
MFRLTTNSDSHGAEFHSFQAARRYADCELAFGKEFVITHTPRGGTWHGRAGMPGEQFQLPASLFTPRAQCEWPLCLSPLIDRLQQMVSSRELTKPASKFWVLTARVKFGKISIPIKDQARQK